MLKPRVHVFVCTNQLALDHPLGYSCAAGGAVAGPSEQIG